MRLTRPASTRSVGTRSLTVSLFCLCIALLMAAVPVQPAMAQSATGKLPRFEVADCLDSVADADERCGYLYVPGDHRKPTRSGVYKLYVVILAASNGSDSARPDPIFYLEGGPGGAATFTASDWVGAPFLDNRDLVLMDQRGAGYSEPSLNCPELEGDYNSYFSAMGDCYDRLMRQGINPSLFNSAQSAADLEALRVTLGYDAINLYGISYGTRLALTMMRDFPDHVRSVVLDSAYPPHVDHYTDMPKNTVDVFDRLLAGCDEDSRCKKAFPDLQTEFYDLLARLNDEPVTVDYNPPEGPSDTYTIGSDDVINILFDALYVSNVIKELPKVIHDAANDDFDGLLDLGYRFGKLRRAQNKPDSKLYDKRYDKRLQADQPDLSDSEGLFFSVECTEEVPFDNENIAKAAINKLPAEFRPTLRRDNEQNFQTCSVWRVTKASTVEDDPVESDIPTLVMAGQYDPITPPRWSQMAAQYLSNSYYFEYPGLGHGVSVDDSCPLDMVTAFIARPTRPPASGCIDDMNAPRWVTR